MSAFTSVRPRGVNAPAKAPRKTNTSKAPANGPVPSPYVYDRTGRRTVSLERRPSGITIESREQSAASLAKRQRISKAGTK